jgi:hypothetical protein
MSILDQCGEIQIYLQKASVRWLEAKTTASNLQSTELENLSVETQFIIEKCHELLGNLVTIIDISDSIQSKIGVFEFLSSSGLISTAVPTVMNTANDASIMYIADSEQRLTDLKKNPSSDYYKNPPRKKVLGDIGELSVLKMLIDPDGEDKLDWTDIQIKQSLKSRITDIDQKPDFYIPSRNLVVDAKAWKIFGLSNLQKVIHKYTNLECLAEGGEVRFYFPSDTYQKYETLVGSVVVRTFPMQATYRELNWQRELMFTYLKFLTLRKK